MRPTVPDSPSDAEEKPRDSVVLRRGCGFIVDLFLAATAFVVTSTRGLRVLHAAGAVDAVSTIESELIVTAGLAGSFALRDALFGGTSPGKRMVGLRVTHPGSEGTPRASASVLRNLPLLLFGLGWIVEFFAVHLDERRRRLGDRLADTQVIDIKPALARLPWTPLFFVMWFGAGPVATAFLPWLARTLLTTHR